MKQNYSLFLLEKIVSILTPEGVVNSLTQSCCEFIATYDTLESAQCHAENIKLKTLIIPSYENR